MGKSIFSRNRGHAEKNAEKKERRIESKPEEEEGAEIRGG
jgi:hypothetical protein